MGVPPIPQTCGSYLILIPEYNCLRLLLSQEIDGFPQWYWGDGWLQSRLEGVSLLTLSLGPTASLLRLREFVAGKQKGSE